MELRQVEQAHAELDRQEEARKLVQQQEAQKRAEVHRAAETERENQRQRDRRVREARVQAEAATEQKRQHRRDVIQTIKREVVEWWHPDPPVEVALRAEILREVEETLSEMAVDELPRHELVEIATGIRERLCGGPERQKRLKRHGVDYASRVLRDVRDLKGYERTQIESRVTNELADIDGDESIEDIEDWVDAILEAEGIEFDEDEE